MPGALPTPPPIMPMAAGPKMPTKQPNPADPDNDGDGGVKIDPSAVHYHDDAQSCQTCSHFQGGNCEVLQMQVSPDGGCNAFAGGAGGDDSDQGDSSSTDQSTLPDNGSDDDNY